MKNRFYLYLKLLLLIPALLLTACGGGGGGSSGGGSDPGSGPNGGNGSENPGGGETSLNSELDTGWTIINQAPDIKKVAFTGSKYIAVGDAGYLAESTDGEDWTIKDAGVANNLVDIAVAGNNAVVVIDPEVGLNTVAYTTDLSSWQLAGNFTSEDCQVIRSITHDGTQFVGAFKGDNTPSGKSEICTSSDGTNWQKQSTQDGEINRMVFGANKYMLMTAASAVNSIDSVTSTNQTLINGISNQTDLIYADSKFVSVVYGQLKTSSDGTTWNSVTGAVVPTNISSVAYSSAKGFTALASTGWLYTSPDATTWTKESNSDFPGIGFVSQTAFVANGTNEVLLINKGNVARTIDNTNWSAPPKPIGEVQAYLEHNGTAYVANNGDYRLLKRATSAPTTDPWQYSADLAIGNLNSIATDSTKLLAAGSTGIANSPDGTTWQVVSDYNKNARIHLSHGFDGTTYYFGELGQILSSKDGVVFQQERSATSGGYSRVASNGSVMLVVLNGNKILRSEVGVNGWQTLNSSDFSLTQIKDLIWSGSKFVMVGNGGVQTSTDGTTWTAGTYISSASINNVILAGGDLYAVAYNSRKIAKSTDDGATWTEAVEIAHPSGNINHLVYDGANFYAYLTEPGAGNQTRLWKSEGDINSWQQEGLVTTLSGFGTIRILHDGSQFVAPLYTEVKTSSDGLVWSTPATAPAGDESKYVAAHKALTDIAPDLYKKLTFDASISQYSAGAAQSTDGENWVIDTSTPPSEISFTPPPSMDKIFIKQLAANQYVLLAKANSGMPGNKAYVSTDPDNWGTGTAFTAHLNNPAYNYTKPSKSLALISDVERDSGNYLVVFNDLFRTMTSKFNEPAKGTMIVKGVDFGHVKLLETQIKSPGLDLIINNNGYVMIGDGGLVATRAKYID